MYYQGMNQFNTPEEEEYDIQLTPIEPEDIGEEDVMEFAQMMGIDPVREKNLVYLAREALCLPPPEPWLLVSMEDDQLAWFNQVNEEIIGEPPHIEEIMTRTQNARKKNEMMKRRGKSSKKDAMAKILGRNIQIEETENSQSPPTKSRRTKKQTKKPSSKKASSKKKGGKFGLLQHIQAQQPENDEIAQMPVGVIEERPTYKTQKTNEAETTQKYMKKGVMESGAFDLSSSESKLAFQFTTDKKSRNKDSQKSQQKGDAILDHDEYAIEGLLDGEDNLAISQDGEGEDSQMKDAGILSGIIEEPQMDPLEAGILGDLDGMNFEPSDDPQGEDFFDENAFLDEGTDPHEQKVGSETDFYQDGGILQEEDQELREGDDIGISLKEPVKYETPITNNRLPAGKGGNRKAPRKEVQKFSNNRLSSSSGEEEGEAGDNKNHPEAAEGYQMIESHVLDQMVNQIQKMQSTIHGLEKDKDVLAKKQEDTMRKTTILEKKLSATHKLRDQQKSLPLSESREFNPSSTSNLHGYNRRGQPQPSHAEDGNVSLKKLNYNNKPINEEENSTVERERGLGPDPEILSLKNEISNIKNLLQNSIVNISQKISDISSNPNNNSNNNSSNNSVNQQLLDQSNSVSIMNKWMKTVVHEKQKLTQDKLALRNRKDKLEHKKLKLRSHEIELGSELQKMKVSKEHPLIVKVRKSLVMQLGGFKEELKDWRDQASAIRVKEKNLSIIENTLTSASTINTLDSLADKHLGELYKTYLSVGKDITSNLYELSESGLSDHQNAGVAGKDTVFDDIDFTETVELANDNRPGRRVYDTPLTTTVAQKGLGDGLSNAAIPEEGQQQQQGDERATISHKTAQQQPTPYQSLLFPGNPSQPFLSTVFLQNNPSLVSNYAKDMMRLTQPSLALKNSTFSTDLNQLRRSYADQNQDARLPAYSSESSKLKNYFNNQNHWFNDMNSKLNDMKRSMMMTSSTNFGSVIQQSNIPQLTLTNTPMSYLDKRLSSLRSQTRPAQHQPARVIRAPMQQAAYQRSTSPQVHRNNPVKIVGGMQYTQTTGSYQSQQQVPMQSSYSKQYQPQPSYISQMQGPRRVNPTNSHLSYKTPSQNIQTNSYTSSSNPLVKRIGQQLTQLITPSDEQEIYQRIKRTMDHPSREQYDLDDVSYNKNRIMDAINDKKGEVNREGQKTNDSHQECLRRLGDLKKKRDALLDQVQRKEKQYQDVERTVVAIEQDHKNFVQQNEAVQHENKVQREKLLEFGKDTNKAVSELDNKLNGVIRLKDHESENSKFEGEGVDNEFSLICAEMEKEYGERFKDIETKTRQLDLDKERGGTKLNEIAENIKNLHRDTERRAKQVVDSVREESRRDLDDKNKVVDSRIRGVEEATRKQKEMNDDHIRKLQDADRQARNRHMNCSNDHSRLRMDLERFSKDNYQVKTMAEELGKQLGAKESELARLETEYRLLEDQRLDLDDTVEKDLAEMQDRIKQDHEEYQDERELLRNKLAGLEDDIRESRANYSELKSKYDGLMSRLHSGLENTISQEIDGYHKGGDNGGGRSYLDRESNQRYNSRSGRDLNDDAYYN